MSEERQERIRKELGCVDGIINVLIRVLMVPILLCGIYIVIDAVGIYANASPSNVAEYKPAHIDASSLSDISDECVAWIHIDDTTIDYPVMRASNNTKYLNRDPYGNYSLAGSIFMDYRNSPDFGDGYTVLYGHHMAAGLMFGALDAYEDERFFDEHLTGALFAGDDEYHLEVYAFLRCDATYNEVFDPRFGLSPERLAWFRQKAMRLHGKPRNRMVALTTCKSPGATERTVLLANIVEGRQA